MNTPSASVDEEVIILVHGTGASAPTCTGTAWWQSDGELWPLIAKISAGKLTPEAFIWSGANSERARRDAGSALCHRLRQLEREGRGVHLVGHSHGGSVIWHALNQFHRKARPDTTE